MNTPTKIPGILTKTAETIESLINTRQERSPDDARRIEVNVERPVNIYQERHLAGPTGESFLRRMNEAALRADAKPHVVPKLTMLSPEEPVIVPDDLKSTVAIRVVYSPDTLESLCAAHQFRMTYAEYVKEQMLARSTKPIPQVEIVPVTDVYTGDHADVYVWIGLNQTPDIIKPELKTSFRRAEHYVLVSGENKMQDTSPVFDEALIALNKKTDHLVDYGMYLRSLVTLFSLCGMERMFQGKRVERLSRNQWVLSQFYKPLVDPIVLQEGFTLAEDAELYLFGCMKGGPRGSPEDRFQMAIQETREILDTTGVIQTLHIWRRSHKVLVTRMERRFWLARRLVQHNIPNYCNIALSRFGVQVCSNIQGAAQRLSINGGRSQSR